MTRAPLTSSATCNQLAQLDNRLAALPLYHYVVLSDTLTPGQSLAQTIHSAGESAALWRRDSSCELPPDTRAVALTASPGALLRLESRLLAAGIAHVAIREPDLGFALVAIGLVPMSRERARRYTSHFPLAGSPRQPAVQTNHTGA